MRVLCKNCGAEFDVANHDEMTLHSFHDNTNNVIGTLVPAKINEGENTMENTLTGVNMENKDGIFTVGMPDGSSAKAVVRNGKLEIINDNDPILNQILQSDFVRNVDFDTQFIAAQTFKLLAYTSGKSYQYSWMSKPHWTEGGWLDGFRKFYSYDYTLKYLATITKRMAKLQKENKKMFDIELHFFNKDVIAASLETYIKHLDKELHSRKTYKCRGKLYIRVGNKHYCDKTKETDKSGMLFVENIEATFITPVKGIIEQIKRTSDYGEIHKLIKQFLYHKLYFKLNVDPASCAEWLDAFKGRGAFFTMQNIVRHSGVKLYKEVSYKEKYMLSREESLNYLMERLKSDKGCYYRLLGLLKASVEANDFNFYDLMKQKYSA